MMEWITEYPEMMVGGPYDGAFLIRILEGVPEYYRPRDHTVWRVSDVSHDGESGTWDENNPAVGLWRARDGDFVNARENALPDDVSIGEYLTKTDTVDTSQKLSPPGEFLAMVSAYEQTPGTITTDQMLAFVVRHVIFNDRARAAEILGISENSLDNTLKTADRKLEAADVFATLLNEWDAIA